MEINIGGHHQNFILKKIEKMEKELSLLPWNGKRFLYTVALFNFILIRLFQVLGIIAFYRLLVCVYLL